jgi:hypothetical protein
MAKSSKNNGSHVTPGIAEDERPSKPLTTDAAAEAPAREPLTSEQLRGLFDAWKATQGDVDAAKQALEAALTKRSECVRVIVEAVGNKGPWTIDGARLSVTVRGDKYNMQRESDAKLTL